jgi:SRSO17 transposase
MMIFKRTATLWRTPVPGTTQQNLQYLLTDLGWDEHLLNRQRIEQMFELPGEGDGALVIDDTGFVKKGSSSVGVARQCMGTAGKVCNCQVTVNCHYAERTLAWPVATRLYLPRAWTDDPARRAVATHRLLRGHQSPAQLSDYR